MNKEYKQTNMSYLEHWKLFQYFSPETIEALLDDFEVLSGKTNYDYEENQDLGDEVQRLTRQVEELGSEVDNLKSENRELGREVSSLEREVSSFQSQIHY
jgi:predicted RNase H-like nuclease (RuvC/YqgF family)